jgi:hypothetical protein
MKTKSLNQIGTFDPIGVKGGGVLMDYIPEHQGHWLNANTVRAAYVADLAEARRQCFEEMRNEMAIRHAVSLGLLSDKGEERAAAFGLASDWAADKRDEVTP